MLNTIIKGSTVRVSGLFVNFLMGMLLTPFILGHLGDLLYGYWSIIAMLLGYYGVFDFGIVSAIYFFISKLEGEDNKYKIRTIVGNAALFFIFMSAVTIIATLIIAFLTHTLYSGSHKNLLVISILIAGFGFSLNFPFRIFTGVLIGYFKFAGHSFIQIFGTILRAAIIYILLKRGLGLVAIVTTTILIDFLKSILIFSYSQTILKIGFSDLKKDTNTLKEILSYSIYRFVAKISNQFRFYFQPLIIAFFMGAEFVTYYTIPSKLMFYFMAFVTAAVGVLGPIFSFYYGKDNFKKLNQTLSVGTKISVLLSTQFIWFAIFFGRDFISLWVGEQYKSLNILMVLLFVGISFDVGQFPANQLLYGTERHRFVSMLSVFEGVSITLLCMIAGYMKWLNGFGIALASILFITRVLVQPLYLCYAFKIPRLTYFFNLLIAPSLISFTLFFLSVELLQNINYIKNMITVLGAASFCGFVSLLGGALLIIEQEQKQKIFRVVFNRS